MPPSESSSPFDSFPFATPALIYREDRLLAALARLQPIRSREHCKVLYSIKSCSCPRILELVSDWVDGLSSSSLFEARLASDVLRGTGTVHHTSPAIPAREIPELVAYVDHISFNSLGQWERFGVGERSRSIRYGLRVNPRLSFVKDDRYNPCRRYSKLGIPIEQLVETTTSNPKALRGISGLHVHTNCESRTTVPILDTVERLVSELAGLLPQLEWINLGGGYQYDEIEELSPLIDATTRLGEDFGLEVFLEPGEAVVGNAGVLVASVLDIVENDGKKIAILDSTVNHLPQVFEYQYEPAIVSSDPDGPHSYLIAGRSCLAGDLFGEYRFASPLEIGAILAFSAVGAYTLVKSHMFNGINLPDLYLMRVSGEFDLIKRYGFDDFYNHSGGYHATDRT